MSLTVNVSNKSDTMKGAVHTLKMMIIKSTESNEAIERRLTTTFDANKSFGEKLLDLFIKHAPNEIAIVSLNSAIFRELMSSKVSIAITQLKNDEQL